MRPWVPHLKWFPYVRTTHPRSLYNASVNTLRTVPDTRANENTTLHSTQGQERGARRLCNFYNLCTRNTCRVVILGHEPELQELARGSDRQGQPCGVTVALALVAVSRLTTFQPDFFAPFHINEPPVVLVPPSPLPHKCTRRTVLSPKRTRISAKCDIKVPPCLSPINGRGEERR